MRTKRVVLLSNHSLLAAGVQRLLQGVDSLDLSIVAAEDSEAISRLHQLTPDVIVLDSGDPSLGEGVITHLLGQHPRAKVVAVNLGRRGIEVFRVHRVIETSLDGLLKAIGGKQLSGEESR